MNNRKLNEIKVLIVDENSKDTEYMYLTYIDKGVLYNTDSIPETRAEEIVKNCTSIIPMGGNCYMIYNENDRGESKPNSVIGRFKSYASDTSRHPLDCAMLYFYDGEFQDFDEDFLKQS